MGCSSSSTQSDSTIVDIEVPDESHPNVQMTEQLVDLATFTVVGTIPAAAQSPANADATSSGGAGAASGGDEPLDGYSYSLVRNVVCWCPLDKASIKGCVVLSHGLHEHSLRYHLIANTLATKGYVVYSVDHIGHGMSFLFQGTKALIPSFERIADDYVRFFKYVQSVTGQYKSSQESKACKLPYFVFGHSMGTMVTLLAVNKIANAAKESGCSLCGVALSGVPLCPGPAAGSPFGLSMLYPLTKTSGAKSLASMLASLDPNGPAAPIMLAGISSDERERSILLKDKRRYPDEIRNKTAFELLKMIDSVKEEIPKIQSTPLFFIHGREDSIALPEGSQFVHDNCGAKTKQIHIKDRLRHEILHESKADTEECLNQIVNFIEQNMPPL